MKFGIDRLLQQSALRQALKGRRVALLAHPARYRLSHQRLIAAAAKQGFGTPEPTWMIR